MKKALSLFLAMLMVLSMTACGEKAPVEGPTEDQPEKVQAQEVYWSACNTSSTYYPLAVAAAEVINQNVPSVHVTIIESGGTSDNFKALEAGQASLGNASDPDTYAAQNGVGNFEGMQYTKPRILALTNPIMYLFAVTEDSGIKCFSDLQGRAFNPGAMGSNSERVSYDVIENILGITPDWVPCSNADAVSFLKDRRIDGFQRSASTIVKDSNIADIETSVDMHILSFTEEEQAKVLEAIPYYSFATMDGSIYDQEDITSIAFFFGFQVSADMDADTVHDIFAALCENVDYMGQSYSAINGQNLAELTAHNAKGYLHAGVIKYLDEQGISYDPSLIPPECK